MTQDIDLFSIQTQLLDRGYRIVPNRGKLPAAAGWNSPEFVAKQLCPTRKGIAKARRRNWLALFSATTIGVRVEAPLAVIDLDIDDPLANALFAAITEIAPEIAAAPMRTFRPSRTPRPSTT